MVIVSHDLLLFPISGRPLILEGILGTDFCMDPWEGKDIYSTRNVLSIVEANNALITLRPGQDICRRVSFFSPCICSVS